jgi:hypothetical protein
LAVTVKDMAGLAALYAVGVVGAFAANLGATSTDKKLDLMRWERVLMFCTFIVMAAIEIWLFTNKPKARAFTADCPGSLVSPAWTCGRKVSKEKSGCRRFVWGRECAIFTPLFSYHGREEASGSPMLCAVSENGEAARFCARGRP